MLFPDFCVTVLPVVKFVRSLARLLPRFFSVCLSLSIQLLLSVLILLCRFISCIRRRNRQGCVELAGVESKGQT